MKTKKCNEHRKLSTSSLTKNNKRNLTDAQIKLLTTGLKFIPTATVTKNKTTHQLLWDYKAFARRMRLRYIFHWQNKPIHAFYVKSNWEPPVQPSVVLENYLEEVTLQIAETNITRPKPNLSRKGRKALNTLKQKKDLNFKKADKGTTIVGMDNQNKIQVDQVQINILNINKPLDKLIVKETPPKVSCFISDLSSDNYIDDMTRKWLSQTPNLPRIPELYTLTNIHKHTL